MRFSQNFDDLPRQVKLKEKVLAASWISLAATIAELPNQVLPVKVKHVSSVARTLTLHCNLAREI